MDQTEEVKQAFKENNVITLTSIKNLLKRKISHKGLPPNWKTKVELYLKDKQQICDDHKAMIGKNPIATQEIYDKEVKQLKVIKRICKWMDFDTDVIDLPNNISVAGISQTGLVIEPISQFDFVYNWCGFKGLARVNEMPGTKQKFIEIEGQQILLNSDPIKEFCYDLPDPKVIKKWLNGDIESCSTEELYVEMKRYFKTFVDLQDDCLYDVLVLFVFQTWLTDMLNSVFYLAIMAAWGCLDEDTSIKVIDNTNKKRLSHKKLKNLPNNFKVVSWNFKENKQEIKDAIKIPTGEKECYEIELEDGSKVIATEEHKFFKSDGKEIETKDLKVGDDLFKLKNSYVGIKNPKLSELNKQKTGKSNPFYGKHHTKDTINTIKGKLKGQMAGRKNPSFGIPRYPKCKFVKELGHNVRSSYEEFFGNYCKDQDIYYQYENKTFDLGNTTYTPDFEIIPNKLYIETKGPIFDKQLEKYKKFLKLNPQIRLIFLSKKKQSIKRLREEGFETYNLFHPQQWRHLL